MVSARQRFLHRLRTVERLFAGAPRLISLILGVVCVVLGLTLLVRPLASLSVLIVVIAASLVLSGAAELLGARSVRAPGAELLVALVSVLAGVGVLVWPGITTRVLAIAVAGVLLVDGAVRILTAHRFANLDARIASVLAGLADIVFGALALSWPDVTLLIVAVIFGARMVWFGLSRTWESLRSHVADAVAEDAVPRQAWRGWLEGWAGVVGAAGALLLALLLTGLSIHFHAGAPTVDAFYVAHPPLPPQPGVLLNSEPFQRNVPAGAQAWRVLYTTTRDDSTSALASALVVAPTNPAPGPRPVIAWAHGTTGFAEGCAPSLAADPFGAGALFLLDQVIQQGWVLVATDYVGLGTMGPHPYLIGQGEGRSVLDAVRAARQLTQLSLANQVIVWGHSQGGHAALWTGMLAPSYAPELNVLGVAALAPASDLIGLVDDLPTVTGGSVFAAYVMAAYSRAYPDVDFSAYIRPAAQVLVQEMSQRCLAEPEVFVSVLTALSLSRDPDIFAMDPTSGPLLQRLNENIPRGPISGPLLIAQGLADPLVLPSVQQKFVAERCAAGQALEYRTYAGRGHVELVEADSPLVPDLISWTQARLAGAPAASTCPA